MAAAKKPDDDDDLNLLTLDQVADKLQCSRRKVYRIAKQKRLEMVKFDNATRITARSVKKFLSDLVKNAESAAAAEETPCTSTN